MFWSKQNFKNSLVGIFSLPALLFLSGCSGYPILTQEGYDRADYIVPKDGHILVVGETMSWNNSREAAQNYAKNYAFHQAMIYTDNTNVKHIKSESSLVYDLGKDGNLKRGYNTQVTKSEIVIESKAIPIQVLNRIKKMDCYQKKKDLKYKFRCLALVEVIN